MKKVPNASKLIKDLIVTVIAEVKNTLNVQVVACSEERNFQKSGFKILQKHLVV